MVAAECTKRIEDATKPKLAMDPEAEAAFTERLEHEYLDKVCINDRVWVPYDGGMTGVFTRFNAYADGGCVHLDHPQYVAEEVEFRFNQMVVINHLTYIRGRVSRAELDKRLAESLEAVNSMVPNPNGTPVGVNPNPQPFQPFAPTSDPWEHGQSYRGLPLNVVDRLSFAIADPVRLKTGGNLMHVEAALGDGRIRCKWTKPSGLVEHGEFASEDLEHAEDGT